MTPGYLFAIGIAVIFMLYMDGAIGVMMLSFLLLMPILSLILTLIVRRRLHISIELPDTSAKQHHLSARIILEKDTPLPLPFLRMNLTADAHFLPLNPDAEDPETDPSVRRSRKERKRRRSRILPQVLPLCLSMGTARHTEYRIKLTPQFCGNGEVKLSDFKLSDYLAMFRFRVPAECSAQILITPEIPELKANSTLFRSVSTAVAAADEETDAAPIHSASSVPGYEHRDYIPGDSLKRINWKLSAKRRHLMVRQDEPVALARLSVVLDFRRDQRDIPMQQRLALEEQLIETALGFLMLCAKYGYPCKLSFADEAGSWNTLSLDDPEQLAVESILLLRGGFRAEDTLAALSVIPPETAQDPGAVLLYFSAHSGSDTAAALEQCPSMLYLVVPEQEAANFSAPKTGSLWLVTPAHELIQAGGEM